MILDLENCSRQSAVWRSVFEGHRRLTRSLLGRTVEEAGGARVEPVARGNSVYRHATIKTLVPALLAPLLSDSPCSSNLHVTTTKRRPGQLSFSRSRSEHVARHYIAPHVDSGELQGGEVAALLSGLINSQTGHACAGDSSVVDTNSLLPLMFGQLTAGLRQLAARTILSTVLFNCTPEQASERLDKICESQGFMLTQLFVKPSLSKPKTSSEASMSYEYEIELGNEMELSFGRRNLDDSNGDLASESLDVTVSDNSSSDSISDALTSPRAASELMETIAKLDRELETIRTECVLHSLDRDLANWETELVATLDRIQSYHAELGSLDTVQVARRRSQELMEELRLQRRLLDSSNKEIEDIERSVASIDVDVDEGGSESAERSDLADVTRRMLDDNWSLGAARFVAAEGEEPDGAAGLGLSRSGEDDDRGGQDGSDGMREYRETLVQTLTVAATYNEDLDDGNEDVASTAGGRMRIPFLITPPMPCLVESDVSSSDSEPESENSSESDTWGGTFSLRHTRSVHPDTTTQAGVSEASIVARLSARTLFALTDYIGLPHSLRPVFSLEAARLQLCLALHSHKAINCDRNCEGEESDTEDSETEDWLHTDSDTDNSEDEGDVVPNLTDSDDDRSSESSLSNFSQRSWYGSLSQITEGRQLSPLSTPPLLTHSEDSGSEEEHHAWLDDREDLRRVRRFLEAGPGPDFTHSTDSESLSD